MGQRIIFSGKLNLTYRGGIGKPSLKWATVAGNRPEARRSIHDQDEGKVTLTGGPNSLMLQN